MQIQIIDSRLQESWFKPSTAQAAGIDLRACIDKPVQIFNGDQLLVSAGFKMALTEGWVGMLYPRSGLGTSGLVLGNLTGVIDGDYRGEVKVCLWNRNMEGQPITIHPLDRIAQMVIVPHYSHSYIELVDELSKTTRGIGGFGSTGSS